LGLPNATQTLVEHLLTDVQLSYLISF
jgi:hypothetical protein